MRVESKGEKEETYHLARDMSHERGFIESNHFEKRSTYTQKKNDEKHLLYCIVTAVIVFWQKNNQKDEIQRVVQ